MANNKKPSDFIEFYIGLLLIISGLFFLLSKAVVHSGFYGFSIGGLNVSTGLVVIPLMFGVVWLVNNPKSFWARLVTIAGSIFIVASIIMNIRITFTTSSFFDYLIMMLLIAGGIGLIIKANLMARKE